MTLSTFKRISVSVLALVLVVAGTFQIALATEGLTGTYYETYDDWKEAEGITSATWNDVVDQMDLVIEEAKAQYAAGNADAAYDCINYGYYGWYETTGFERIAMGYISGSRKTEMELQFSACKAVTKNGGSTDEFDTECVTLSAMLREDANILDGNTSSSDSSSDDSGSSSSSTSAGAAAFIACFTIILREGFEAILVVGAIAAYLRKGAKGDKALEKKQTRPVYIGAILGIVASFVTAWILNLIKLANSASQEVIEGITALIAVCVLYYVSNWMLSKSESEAWSAYIKKQISKGTAKNSMAALAFTSFLAVYREGAEVILFYQPMLSGDYSKGAVWGGFIVGCICLVGVFYAIHFLSVKIPLKPFFLATSVLMFIMSIAFLGSGIKELIEGDVFTMWAPSWVSWIPSNAVLEILGIYPCGQTVIAQLILLAITIAIFVYTANKNKKLREQVIAETGVDPRETERLERPRKYSENELNEKINTAVAEALKAAGITADTSKTAKKDAGKK